MPKLPQSLASGEVPGYVAGGQPNVGAWTATGRAVDNFADMAERESQKWALVEDRLTDSRNKVFEAQVLSSLKAKRADFLSKVGDDKSGAVVAEEWNAEASTFLDQQLANVNQEGLRNAIRARATLHIADGADAARAVANDRVMDATKTAALEQIRELSMIGSEQALREGTDLIRGLTAAGVFSAERGAELEEYLRSHSVKNAAAASMSMDPYATAEMIDKGQGIFGVMSDAERKAGADHARKEGDRIQIQSEQYQAGVHAEALREEEQLAKRQEKRWGENEVELLDGFLAKPDSDPRIIIQAARSGLIKPDYTHVNQLMGALKDIRAQANDRDDPDTLTNVDSRVYDVRGPQITSNELLTLRQRHMISDSTFRRSLQVLKADADLRRAEGDKATSELQQVRMGAYSAGKQVIDDWFTTVGAIASDDKEQIVVLKGQALNQFWDLTKGGRLSGVDPTEALPYVMQQFRTVGTGVAKTLLNQVPPEYRDPRKLKKAYDDGRVKPTDYQRWRTFLVNANDIVPMAEWETMHAPPTLPAPKPATPAPTTGGRRAPQP